MKKITKHWIEFYHPGSLFAETSTQDCEANIDPESVEFPESAYAFKIKGREDIVDGETIYRGDKTNSSPYYYHPDSKIESLEEVRKNPNATSILIRNMECNNWDKIIWNRWGYGPQPIHEGDLILKHENNL